MFQVRCQSLSKRFKAEWIFKDLDYTFEQGKAYALTGANGSGKSTLLQILAGSQLPSSGLITYSNQGKVIAHEDIFKNLALATPYLELIEEFTLEEHINFHFEFKAKNTGRSVKEMAEFMQLGHVLKKPIKYFSSGMKQRLKLGLCFCSETAILLLDEPTTNLDIKGIDWYLEMILKQIDQKMVIIASNQTVEYDFCKENLLLDEYKF